MASSTEAVDKISYTGGAWHLAALLAGNVALALGPWLVRLTDTGPVAAGFWRMLLPLPLFALLAWRERGTSKATPRTVVVLLAAGAFFAADLACWHIGIEQTRLGNATLFGNAGSILMMVWGLFALRRAPARMEWIAFAAAIGGAAILMGRSLEISTSTLVGDLFCLAAGVFYVFYLVPAQAARATLGQWSVLTLVSAAAAPALLGIALALGEPIWPGPAGWTPVFALALSSQIVGQGLLVYSMKHFPPLVVGMALLTQPAIAAAVGWLAFGEVLAGADILGMALVSAALVLARTRAPVGPRVRAP
ncbi:EamA-like transporter family protein [Tsuneonella dongtanensis]|uniref:EamA-like transporter family protein n=1 Tax=Tsuneonella dongtanensis TaxID=692370 RepID=A0A1B2ABF3_9SPHN|nr:DMT family transporter [Tsuneonella dongtanensis]ANY19487.1 EamA-like transporter family protein [Tsuneonella dongtanensis]